MDWCYRRQMRVPARASIAGVEGVAHESLKLLLLKFGVVAKSDWSRRDHLVMSHYSLKGIFYVAVYVSWTLRLFLSCLSPGLAFSIYACRP